MACAQEAELRAFVAGEVDDAARRAIEVQLDACAHCRERLGELARDAESAEAVAAEPTRLQGLLGGAVDPRVGSIIGGRYRVVRLLGSGGMGAVYEVVHTVIQRPYALKVLHPRLATSPAACPPIPSATM